MVIRGLFNLLNVTLSRELMGTRLRPPFERQHPQNPPSMPAGVEGRVRAVRWWRHILLVRHGLEPLR